MAKPVDPAVIAVQEAGVAKMMQLMPRPLINGQPAPRDLDEVEDTTDIDECVARISRKGVMNEYANLGSWHVDQDQPGMTEDSLPASMHLKTSEQH
ncbi:hypothetical protein CROQUDRAFT_86508 [Cronartium quercuum f. sp. fusiforme G11]|uniref:Uncharacterized protein n=1 Tax=Cronartium quercuum f. sp. fusiforme G11 TaxID=708437 RepID=A0A9P6TGX9_9BASI|nr:hypothetical protein CROQUDRAFT_86508 [Cronartium quercuum f. sp. fusiforme G11]